MLEFRLTTMTSLCPHTDPFAVGGHDFAAARIIEALTPYLTEERRGKIERVVANRSYSILPVMEGPYDRGNVSAVLRSAEALGYQAVHIIETSAKFKKAIRVTQGAEKWLDVRSWDTTRDCVGHLRGQGYRILAAHVEDARPITEFAFDEPTALFFGNEHEGLTDELLGEADARVMVPMPGFTRSFNISVAAAIALYHIYQDRTQRLGAHGDLSESDRECLTASYYLRCVDYADKLLVDSLQTDSKEA